MPPVDRSQQESDDSTVPSRPQVGCGDLMQDLYILAKEEAKSQKEKTLQRTAYFRGGLHHGQRPLPPATPGHLSSTGSPYPGVTKGEQEDTRPHKATQARTEKWVPQWTLGAVAKYK